MAESDIRTSAPSRSLEAASPTESGAPEGHDIHGTGVGDAELIEAIARHDGDALATLYDRHGSIVYAVCLRILQSAEEAEEVLEDVFWQLWQHADRYQIQRGSALAYLTTLARSRAIDRVRTRTRRARLGSELGEGGSGDPEPLRSPLHDTLLRERNESLQRALSALPVPQREAVELSFLEGLSHPEISSRLGEPLGTIKTRIRTGLLRLRDALTDPAAGVGS